MTCRLQSLLQASTLHERRRSYAADVPRLVESYPPAATRACRWKRTNTCSGRTTATLRTCFSQRWQHYPRATGDSVALRPWPGGWFTQLVTPATLRNRLPRALPDSRVWWVSPSVRGKISQRRSAMCHPRISQRSQRREAMRSLPNVSRYANLLRNTREVRLRGAHIRLW